MAGHSRPDPWPAQVYWACLSWGEFVPSRLSVTLKVWVSGQPALYTTTRLLTWGSPSASDNCRLLVGTFEFAGLQGATSSSNERTLVFRLEWRRYTGARGLRSCGSGR